MFEIKVIESFEGRIREAYNNVNTSCDRRKNELKIKLKNDGDHKCIALRNTLENLYPNIVWQGDKKFNIPFASIKQEDIQNFSTTFQKEQEKIKQNNNCTDHIDHDKNIPKIKNKKCHYNVDIKNASLEELILSGYKSVEASRGKNCVFFLGNTQAGKSTLINYLIGCKIIKSKISGKEVAMVEGEEILKIGHDLTKSETFLPQIVQNKELPFAYYDCPGFQDSRGEKAVFCTNIVTHFAIEFSSSIQAIAIVVGYNTIAGENRGKSFQDLIITLTNLISNVAGIEGSILFFITKAPPKITKQDIVDTITQFHDELWESYIQPLNKTNNNMLLEQQKKEKEDLFLKLKFLKLMKKCSNVILADVFDDSYQARNEMIRSFKNVSPIPKSRFDLSIKNDARNAIIDIIKNGTELLTENKSLMEKIANSQVAYDVLNKEVESSKIKLQELNDKTYVFSPEQKIVELQSKLENNRRNFYANENDLKNLIVEKQNIASSIGKLKDNNKINYIMKSKIIERHWYDFFGILSSTTFDYEGEPCIITDAKEIITTNYSDNIVNNIINKIKLHESNNNDNDISTFFDAKKRSPNVERSGSDLIPNSINFEHCISFFKEKYVATPCSGNFSPKLDTITEYTSNFKIEYTPKFDLHLFGSSIKVILCVSVPEKYKKTTGLEVQKLQQKEEHLIKKINAKQDKIDTLNQEKTQLEEQIKDLEEGIKDFKNQRSLDIKDLSLLIDNNNKELIELKDKINNLNKKSIENKRFIKQLMPFFDMIIAMHAHTLSGGTDLFQILNDNYIKNFIIEYKQFLKKITNFIVYEAALNVLNINDPISSIHLIGDFNQWLPVNDIQPKDSLFLEDWTLIKRTDEDETRWELDVIELPAKNEPYKYKFRINNEFIWPDDFQSILIELPYAENDSNINDDHLEEERTFSKTKGSGTEFHKAVSNGDEDKIGKLFISNPSDINTRDDINGYTPLHYAVKYRNIKMLKLLIEKGAWTNCQDHTGRTPVYIACHEGWLEGVEILIEKKVELNKCNEEGNSPLHAAVQENNVDIAVILLKNRINCAIINNAGENFLHIAIKLKCISLVNKLINHINFDLFELDNQKKSPLHLTVDEDQVDILDLLIKPFLNIAKKIKIFARNKIKTNNNRDLIYVLNMHDSQGDTFFHKAAREGRFNIINWTIEKQKLLKQALPIDLANKQGDTALHLSAENGHYRIVELLLNQGASFEIRNNQGLSIFEIVTQKLKSSPVENRKNYEEIKDKLADCKKQKLLVMIKKDKNSKSWGDRLFQNVHFKTLIKDNPWDYVIKAVNFIIFQIIKEQNDLKIQKSGGIEEQCSLVKIDGKIPEWIDEFNDINQAFFQGVTTLPSTLNHQKTPNEIEFNKELKGNLTQYYNISKAILQTLVRRPLESWDSTAESLKEVASNISRLAPTVGNTVVSVGEKLMPSFVGEITNKVGVPASTIGNAVGTLIGIAGESMANAIARIIVEINDKIAKKNASNLVNAFEEEHKERADSQKIKRVVKGMTARYRDQINALRSEKDVSIFANYIAQKIIDHIVAGRNKYENESSYWIIRKRKEIAKTLVKDYRPDPVLDIVERCILSITIETEKEKNWDKYKLITKNPSAEAWYAPGIIKATGAKLIDKKGEITYYVPPTEKNKKQQGWEIYGFYYANNYEVDYLKKNKQFKRHDNIKDILAPTNKILTFSSHENSVKQEPTDTSIVTQAKLNSQGLVV